MLAANSHRLIFYHRCVIFIDSFILERLPPLNQLILPRLSLAVRSICSTELIESR